MENAVIQSPPDWRQLTEEDRAVFERVWRRVMPEAGQDGPISIEPVEGAARLGGDVPCILACPVSAAPRPQQQAAAGAQKSERTRPGSPRGGSGQIRGESARPGAGAGQEDGPAGTVGQQVLSALELWQLYRALARRGGARAGQLSAMAAQVRRAAGRLSAACFLLTGIRYWPAQAMAAPRIPAWEGGLRMAYQRERQQAQGYRRGARAAPDEALGALYRELADGCERRCRTLWELLSRGGT